MKTYLIKSNGCVLNQLDGAHIEALINQNGHNLTKKYNKADLVIINSCAYNKIKEEHTIELIKQATKQSVNGEIVVCGCFPKINPQLLAEYFGGKSFSPNEINELEKHLQLDSEINHTPIFKPSYNQYSVLKRNIFNLKKITNLTPFIYKIRSFEKLLNSLFVYSDDICCLRIASGCTGLCTYCAIKFAKGKVKSKSISNINVEIKHAISKGSSKFALYGDEIGAYGNDFPNKTNLLDVLNLLHSNNSVSHIYLPWLEPSFLVKNFDSFMPFFAKGKIRILELPVQNGSNRILQLMKRSYNIEDVVNCVTEIQKNHPRILLRTDIIVGFPGETEKDFNETFSLVKKNIFDFIHIYTYEDRPKTRASKFPNKISDKTKKNRKKKLIKQQRKNYFILKPAANST